MEYSSNAALFYNSSHGVDEGPEQIKFTDSIGKKLVLYMDRYKYTRHICT